jgi:hypothetical protein
LGTISALNSLPERAVNPGFNLISVLALKVTTAPDSTVKFGPAEIALDAANTSLDDNDVLLSASVDGQDCISEKNAVADLSALMTRVHFCPCPAQSLSQRSKANPDAGFAVNSTDVLDLYLLASPGQSGDGLSVIEPPALLLIARERHSLATSEILISVVPVLKLLSSFCSSILRNTSDMAEIL